jgi:hypothetical protein
VNWIPLEDWAFLPQGVVFSDQNSTSYNTITLDVQPPTGVTNRFPGVGTTNTACFYFNSVISNMPMSALGTAHVCAVEFKPTGQVSSGFITGNNGTAGIRLVQGSVLDASTPRLVVSDSNNWVYIEYDRFGGRVRTRYRDSYR